ncbi:hypothetical protein [Leifsonia sp. NPDC077715]|uniref:hypothetical protein n=1 Tax=Leifsonia sp. NPDC077715 TaxID=3155539 RepID=UPI0034396175
MTSFEGSLDGSVAVHRMVRLKRELDAEEAYVDAFAEWDASGEHALWDQTAGDGLGE